jgi:hypothetical protein
MPSGKESVDLVVGEEQLAISKIGFTEAKNAIQSKIFKGIKLI